MTSRNRKGRYTTTKKSFGSYLRTGIAYTATLGIALSATAYSTSDRDYRHATKLEFRLRGPKVELNKYVERLSAEAAEVARESYRDSGHYDIEKLAEIQQQYFDYLSYKGVSSEEPLRPLMPTIREVAEKEDLNPNQIGAIVTNESWCWRWTVGSDGELGLMQIDPNTHKLTPWEYKNIFNPRVNIAIGASIYKRYLNQFHGDVPKAMEAYNGGPRPVLRRRVPIGAVDYMNNAMRHIEVMERNDP